MWNGELIAINYTLWESRQLIRKAKNIHEKPLPGRLRTVRNDRIILCIGALRARVGFNCPDEPPWGLLPTPSNAVGAVSPERTLPPRLGSSSAPWTPPLCITALSPGLAPSFAMSGTAEDLNSSGRLCLPCLELVGWCHICQSIAGVTLTSWPLLLPDTVIVRAQKIMTSCEAVTESKYTLSGTWKQGERHFSSNCEQLPLNRLLKPSSTKNKNTSKPLATHCSLILAARLVCLFWKCSGAARTADKSRRCFKGWRQRDCVWKGDVRIYAYWKLSILPTWYLECCLISQY